MPRLLTLVAFACGVGALQTCAELPRPAWGPVVAGVVALAIVHVHACARPVAVALACAAATLMGFGYAAIRADWRMADALGSEWEGVDLRIVGVVDDLPRRSENGARFAFAIERVEPAHARVPTRISLAWPSPSVRERGHDHAHSSEAPLQARVAAEDEGESVRAGERWSLAVRLKRPHGNYNEGGFDLEAWLLERNLRATGYVRPGEEARRLDPFAGRVRDAVQQAREAIRERAFRVLGDAPHAAVAVALAIGDQSGMDEATWKVFNRTGTGHLVSVSGLHVTVFATLSGGLALALARRSVALTARIPARRVAAAFGVVAAGAYVQIAGAEIPAQRTLLMLVVAAIGLWIGRPGSGLVVWTWALVAVLLFDPWAVLAVGFWLSFCAVGLLIHVSSGRRAHARGGIARATSALRDAARSQWAITVGLVPLSLALFGQVSLIGPLANAIAIPAITFGVVPVVLAASALPLDALWQLAHALLVPLMRALDGLASLPVAAWTQHRPPDWATVAGIVAVALALGPRGMPGRCVALVGLVPLFVVRPDAPAEGAFRLSVLDVGQGTAVVVRTRAHALLYDTGPRWTESTDAGGRIIAPYLRAVGIRTLDALIISHRDLDHAGGAATLLETVPAGFMLSSLDDNHELLALQARQGVHARCLAGQHWEWDGVRFEILFPQAAHYDDRSRKPNDVSCVLRVSAGKSSALLAGDIEARSEVDLLIERRPALRSDVLVVPHHGSRTSSTVSFVEAVDARHAVFTVGYRNRFGHPRADVVARYVTRGTDVHRTDRTGALTFEMLPEGPGPPRASRELRRRYWHVAT